MKNNNKINWWYVIIVILVFPLIVTLWVYLVINHSVIDLTDKNNIGDALGGITNPIIGLFGVIVTFLAFYIQYQFNREQSKLIAAQRREREEDKKEQIKQNSRQAFDKKFYELLKLHNDNVREFNIDNKYYGRKTFVKIHNELTDLDNLVRIYLKDLDNFEKCKVSYELLFHGFDSFKFLLLEEHKSVNSKYYSLLKEIGHIHRLYEKDKAEGKEFYYGLFFDSYDYYPFDGHSHRLNHYFRHLLNFLEIIDAEPYFEDYEKQQYFDIIRGQLSNYEQVIIYYNAIVWFPDKWHTFITKYRLIKNIPLELCNLDPKPDKYYIKEIEEYKKQGIRIFNWVDLNN